jgi:hypothetical protein
MATQNLHIGFGVTAMSNDALDLDTRNLIWRYIMAILTKAVWHIVYMSTIKNMATVNRYGTI